MQDMKGDIYHKMTKRNVQALRDAHEVNLVKETQFCFPAYVNNVMSRHLAPFLNNVFTCLGVHVLIMKIKT